MVEPSKWPSLPGERADVPGAEVRDIDLIDVGGSLLPARLATLARTPGGQWAVRAVAALLSLVVIIAAATAVAGRAAVTDGVPPPEARSAASLSPFERVLALTHQGPLTGYIRQVHEPGSCAPVPLGYSPERSALGVIRRFVPLATETDAARTLDQFGLCSLQLRATAPGQVRVVVSISAPPARPAPSTLDALEVGLENRGTDTVEYVLATQHTGWQVLIGAVGSVADLPRTTDLTMAAAAPQMQW